MASSLTLDRVSVLSAAHQTIVRDVSLRAEPGEAISVIGRSGAGKTTVLRLLNGLARPSTGSVTIDDRAARRRPRCPPAENRYDPAGAGALSASNGLRQRRHCAATPGMARGEGDGGGGSGDGAAGHAARTIWSPVSAFALRRRAAARFDRASDDRIAAAPSLR